MAHATTLRTARPQRRPNSRGRYMELISNERLALLMREKGFTVARMARYADHKSHSYISRMVRGVPGAKTVTPRTAELIAEALGVPVELLFMEKRVQSVDSTPARGKAVA